MVNELYLYFNEVTGIIEKIELQVNPVDPALIKNKITSIRELDGCDHFNIRFLQ